MDRPLATRKVGSILDQCHDASVLSCDQSACHLNPFLINIKSYKRAIQEAEAVYKRLEPTMRYRGESGDAVRASKADKRKSNRDSSFLKVLSS